MVISVRHLLIILGIFFLLITSGCNGNNPAQTIYTHLEKAVVLEEVFEQQQQPLLAAEKKRT